jgi:type IV pilus assembly protein PilE
MRTRGFNLVELVIVLALVAILVTLALPSWQDALRKSRRSDGMQAITTIHLAQERWRVNNTTYASLAQLGVANPYVSSDAHYSLTVSGTSATGYTITAAPQGDQANDSCGNFVLTFNAGVITKTAGGDDARCWTK